MKKYTFLKLSFIIYFLFLVSTIITLFIVYKNIDNSLSFKFVIGYLIFLLLYSLYFIFVAIANLRRSKWTDIRKRLFKFITLFALFIVLNYGFDYVFRPSNIDLYREIFIALGLAFAESSIDITFLKRKKN